MVWQLWMLSLKNAFFLKNASQQCTCLSCITIIQVQKLRIEDDVISSRKSRLSKHFYTSFAQMLFTGFKLFLANISLPIFTGFPHQGEETKCGCKLCLLHFWFRYQKLRLLGVRCSNGVSAQPCYFLTVDHVHYLLLGDGVVTFGDNLFPPAAQKKVCFFYSTIFLPNEKSRCSTILRIFY